MIKRTSSFIAAFSIFIAVVMVCSMLAAIMAGAQMAQQYSSQPAPYANPNIGTPTGSSDNSLTIQGLEGIEGFTTGENQLSLAVMPVSQQGSQMGFQVIGFAVSSPDTGVASVYSLTTPLAGVIDSSQNTLQIDLTNLANAINNAGFIQSSQIYDTLRTDPKVIIIDVNMNYQGVQGSQTTFSVNSVDIVPPDGNMQAFSLQQSTQLVIDSQSMRIYMVAFPQMVDAFDNYYGASFNQVQPVVYAQPVSVLAPVFVPYLTPYPIFFGFVGFSPYTFGSSFVSFYNFNTYKGHFPIHDHTIGRSQFNQFRQGVNMRGGQIGRGGENQRGSNPTRPGNVGGILPSGGNKLPVGGNKLPAGGNKLPAGGNRFSSGGIGGGSQMGHTPSGPGNKVVTQPSGGNKFSSGGGSGSKVGNRR
jgi:hypothetical protein